jgi:hypothetical protein
MMFGRRVAGREVAAGTAESREDWRKDLRSKEKDLRSTFKDLRSTFKDLRSMCADNIDYDALAAVFLFPPTPSLYTNLFPTLIIFPMRLLFLSLFLLATSLSAQRIERMQVGGEWCFVMVPEQPRQPAAAILTIHGNTHTVTPTTSNWEQVAGTARIMKRFLAAGYYVAQSNHTGTPTNGMWGNTATVRTVAALQQELRRRWKIQRFHGIAESAGNATLVNGVLTGKLQFTSAVLMVPVLSLESMYTCPGGFERVKGISEAFGFAAAGPCPGNPESDQAFRNATATDDPLRRMRTLKAKEIKTSLGKTRWLGLYNLRDPKVLTPGNILPFEKELQRAGLAMTSLTLDEETHASDRLLETHADALLAFYERR